jgi:hypothetical protein
MPASGVYRAVIVLLTVWTVFAGLALVTQGVPALSIGASNAAERIIGSQMLMLVPIYALIIWRPDDNYNLRWIPYAAQLVVIVPFFWDSLITGDQDFFDGTLLFLVSCVFLGVLVYLRSSAHPLGFFADQWEEDDEEEALDEEEYVEDEAEEGDLAEDDEADEEPQPEREGRGRRYRRN